MVTPGGAHILTVIPPLSPPPPPPPLLAMRSFSFKSTHSILGASYTYLKFGPPFWDDGEPANDQIQLRLTNHGAPDRAGACGPRNAGFVPSARSMAELVCFHIAYFRLGTQRSVLAICSVRFSSIRSMDGAWYSFFIRVLLFILSNYQPKGFSPNVRQMAP